MRIAPGAVLISFLLLLLSSGCVRVRTEPIRIEPIYIEITINHRVQEELDSLFAGIDQASETMDYEPLEKSSSKPEN
mgnify:CR=1 FL=1